MNEFYRLTLEHFVSYDKGMSMISEPLVVQMVIDHKYNPYPTPVCINRMLDMMKDEVMKRVGEADDHR